MRDVVVPHGNFIDTPPNNVVAIAAESDLALPASFVAQRYRSSPRSTDTVIAREPPKRQRLIDEPKPTNKTRVTSPQNSRENDTDEFSNRKKPQVDDDMILPEWHTLPMRNEKSIYLRFLLLQLARRNAPRDKIPYRKALIQTPLSDKYEMRVNAKWDEETEDVAIKLLRREFSFDYLRNIVWSSIKQEKLFLGDNEDLHQVNHDAFDEAMSFPLRLGIVGDEDLDCNTLIEADPIAPK